MKDQKYDALTQLLGCYLHQDWVDEFDSDITALRSARDNEQKELVSAGIAELDALLASNYSETELEAVLAGQVGCYFAPESIGLSWKEWLGRARGILSGSIKG